jgi:hypothetical protein
MFHEKIIGLTGEREVVRFSAWLKKQKADSEVPTTLPAFLFAQGPLRLRHVIDNETPEYCMQIANFRLFYAKFVILYRCYSTKIKIR